MLRRELQAATLVLLPILLSGCTDPAHLQATASGAPAPEPDDAAGPAAPGVLRTEWTNFTRSYALATSPGLLLMDKGDSPNVLLAGNESVNVEMAWDATGPGARELVLVVSLDGRDVASVRGASPLAWVPDETLKGNLTARPALPAGSVVAQQDVHLAVMVQRPG